MSAKQDTYEHEASIVRRLMRDGARVFFTKHAQERMLERSMNVMTFIERFRIVVSRWLSPTKRKFIGAQKDGTSTVG